MAAPARLPTAPGQWYRCAVASTARTKLSSGKRRLPKERSARSRRIFNDTLLATLGVVVATCLLALGGLALDWLVFSDRYGLGFFDYLRVVVF